MMSTWQFRLRLAVQFAKKLVPPEDAHARQRQTHAQPVVSKSAVANFKQSWQVWAQKVKYTLGPLDSGGSQVTLQLRAQQAPWLRKGTS